MTAMRASRPAGQVSARKRYLCDFYHKTRFEPPPGGSRLIDIHRPITADRWFSKELTHEDDPDCGACGADPRGWPRCHDHLGLGRRLWLRLRLRLSQLRLQQLLRSALLRLRLQQLLRAEVLLLRRLLKTRTFNRRARPHPPPRRLESARPDGNVRAG